MKLGILTFHSQLNYGGVLQAYALQEELITLGHEVQVIDLWLGGQEFGINLRLDPPRISFIQKIKTIIRRIFLTGWQYRQIRKKKTKCYIEHNLNLTKYHFWHWDQITQQDLDFDYIIVGSDQVWNCCGQKEGPFRDFLLENAPAVKAISYAVSLGMKTIPLENRKIYFEGWNRFQAISVREREGVNILRGFGIHSVHVLDPTLLLPRRKWFKIIHCQKDGQKRLVCYFMRDNWYDVLPNLIKYSQNDNIVIDVFFNDGCVTECPLPFGKDKFKVWLTWVVKILFSSSHNVNWHFDASPDEFLHILGMATDVISDSFHALMFSIIFELNVRIFKPRDAERRDMFARIEEIQQFVQSGNFIVDDISAAFSSLDYDEPVKFNYEKIEQWRSFSENWLKEQLQVSNHP